MRLAVVGAIVLMLSGMAMAQTPFTIDFELQIGGDNHEAQYKNEENVAFTPGTADPGATEYTGIITWDVVAAASGSDGVNSIQGIANLVFNVQLQDEAGTPVAPAKFLSTINDGNFNSPRAQNAGVAEPFERAAFCLGWDVAMDYKWDDSVYGNGDYYPDPGEDPALCYFDGTGPAFGPGRLYDPVTVGGPYMDRVQYPSTVYHGGGRMKGGAYFADCNGSLAEDDTEEDGVTDTNGNGILDVCETLGVALSGAETLSADKLSGMGAGYSQFSASANNLGIGLAVASVVPTWYTFDEYVGLGIKPVCEGQIDMTNLQTGTYKLVLTVPENANNVVPVSYVPGDAGGFAVKADVVNGDEIVFFYKGVDIVAIQPVLWESVRTHGAGGDFAIPLVATDGANPTTEPRNGGIAKIKIHFDGSLALALYTGGVTVTPSAGLTVIESTEGDNTIVLDITGDVDKACYKIDVAGAFPAAGLKGTADPTCLVGNLIGDSNNSRTVNTIDMAQVKTKIGQVVNAGNCRQDLNLSNSINTIDMSLAKSKVPNALDACP
ncbi:MAG: hypothetical protein GX616_04770 [Planctomycetes bacterium]|nr:hypothetical protein [Planctomycetota bacterium]